MYQTPFHSFWKPSLNHLLFSLSFLFICSHSTQDLFTPMTSSLRQTFVDASLHLLKIAKVNGDKCTSISHVIRALDLTPVNLAVALVFLLRYNANSINTIDACESENLPYYLIITSLVLSNKYLNDQSYTLRLWLSIICKCLKLLSSLPLLNQMETHMLAALGYRLTTSHDLTLWRLLDHLDRTCIRKLRVAVDCEKPGAFYSSICGTKRSAGTLKSCLRSSKVSRLCEAGSSPFAQVIHPGILTYPLLGLATPPSCERSPSSTYNKRKRQHQKLSTISSQSVALCTASSVPSSSLSLPSTFVPAMARNNQSNYTPVAAVVQPAAVAPISSFSSVYATPCSLLMGPYTPRTYSGPITPINYISGSSIDSTPSIGGMAFNPGSFTGSCIPFHVAHPYHVQTPESKPLKSASKAYGSTSNISNHGFYGDLGSMTVCPTTSVVTFYENA